MLRVLVAPVPTHAVTSATAAAAAAAAEALIGTRDTVAPAPGRASVASVDEERRRALAAAKERLDRLDLYPRPVSLRRVRLVVTPWPFRLPWFRRFDGYATHVAILVRSRALLADGDLVTHELCHVWQMQHRPLRMPLSYLLSGYASNRYEHEARQAASTTRSA